MKVIEVGTRVRALKLITDDGGPEDPEAEPAGPGWVHARPGDEGVVTWVGPVKFLDFEEGTFEEDEALVGITVHFDKSETSCTVMAFELEPAFGTFAVGGTLRPRPRRSSQGKFND